MERESEFEGDTTHPMWNGDLQPPSFDQKCINERAELASVWECGVESQKPRGG